MTGFLTRILRGLFLIAVGVDQLAQTVIVFAPFVAGLAPEPDPDATISGVVGRGVIARRWWARPLAVPIDALFWLFGDGPDHCVRQAIAEQYRLEPRR